MTDRGGRGVRQILTLADKDGRGDKANADKGLATNDITDKMAKNYLIYWLFSNSS